VGCISRFLMMSSWSMLAVNEPLDDSLSGSRRGCRSVSSPRTCTTPWRIVPPGVCGAWSFCPATRTRLRTALGGELRIFRVVSPAWLSLRNTCIAIHRSYLHLSRSSSLSFVSSPGSNIETARTMLAVCTTMRCICRRVFSSGEGGVTVLLRGWPQEGELSELLLGEDMKGS
jgi:hypothetical protein